MAETSDFAGARAALSTSMAVIGPMLQAMQDASKVFDAMANAQAHVDVLTAGVVKAQAEQKKIATSIEKATAKIEAAENTAQAAETASLKRVAEAQADADTAMSAKIKSDDAPPTRAELQQKADELGIKVDGRWSDRKLGDVIAAAIGA